MSARARWRWKPVKTIQSRSSILRLARRPYGLHVTLRLVRRPYGLHAIPAIIQIHGSHKAQVTGAAGATRTESQITGAAGATRTESQIAGAAGATRTYSDLNRGGKNGISTF